MTSSSTAATSTSKTKAQGVLHGDAEDDYLKVPRCLLYAGRFVGPDHPLANARHRLLLLALWARYHKNTPVREYWENLARDMGVSSSTVRQWAYTLREAKLLKIVNHKGPVRQKENGRPGRRDERNTFDLAPLWKALDERVEPKRKEQRKKAKSSERSAKGTVS